MEVRPLAHVVAACGGALIKKPNGRTDSVLYSTQNFGYDHLSGLEVTIADEASIDDLLVYLNLAPKRLGIVSMDGRVLKKKSPLKDGAQIKIFQPIAGG